MGADVAASPHCPVRLNTKPGRRGSPLGGFEVGDEPGARTPSSGVVRGLALLSVSPRAPRQGRSPGGSPLADPEPGFRLPPPAAPEPKLGAACGRTALAEACTLPGGPWTEVLGPPVSQLPGRNPVLPDASGTEVPLPPVAVRRLASRCCRTGPGPKPFTCLSIPNPKVRNPGASRSLP